MSKGFIFSLDAAFAIIILSLFIITFSFFTAEFKEDPYNLLILEKISNDALITMDKTGELSTMNLTLINYSLTQMFGSSISWNLHMDYYNYSNDFNLYQNYTIGGDYSNIDSLVLAQREFLVFEDKSISYFGIAKLRVWVG